MVVILDIWQVRPGLYQALCQGEKNGSTQHTSISEALAYYGNSIPPKFAKFVDPRYGGVSLGTTAVSDLACNSEALADQLTSMVFRVFHS